MASEKILFNTPGEGSQESHDRQSSETKETGLDNIITSPHIWWKRETMVKTIAGTALSTIASVLGVKSVHDVPAWMVQRIRVRGDLLGMKIGKGVEGAVENLVSEYNIQAREKQDRKTLSIGPIPEEQEIESKKERLSTIKDVEKRLLMTKDARRKGSEARKIIAEVIRKQRGKKRDSITQFNRKDGADISDKSLIEKLLKEYEAKTDTGLDQNKFMMRKAIDDYMETKVTGVQAARESLNTVLTASGAYALRGASYGLMDGMERYQRLAKENRRDENGKSRSELIKDTVVGGITKTAREAFLADAKGEKHSGFRKSVDFVRAWGKIIRYTGLAAAVTGDNPRSVNLNKDIDKILDAFEGKLKISDIADNFKGNADRIIDGYKSVLSGSWGWVKGKVGLDSVEENTTKGQIATETVKILAQKGEVGQTQSGILEVKEKSSLNVTDANGRDWQSTDGKNFTAIDGNKTVSASRVNGKLIITESNVSQDKTLVKGTELKIAEKITELPVASADFKISGSIEIKSGDSLWSVSDKYLKGNDDYQKLINDTTDKNLAQALRTHNIDRIKDAITADPGKYGLPKGANIDKLTVSQLNSIKWQDAFNDVFKKEISGILSAQQADSIVNNNQVLRDFFAQHPDAPKTSENYISILKGKGISGESLAELNREPVTEEEKSSEPPAEPVPEPDKVPDVAEAVPVYDPVKTGGEIKDSLQEAFSYKFLGMKFSGQFEEEWAVLKNMKARDALGVKFKLLSFKDDAFGEHIKNTTGNNYAGSQLDAAEINNRRDLQKYLVIVRTKMNSEPGENESIEAYLGRYKNYLDRGRVDIDLNSSQENIGLSTDKSLSADKGLEEAVLGRNKNIANLAVQAPEIDAGQAGGEIPVDGPKIADLKEPVSDDGSGSIINKQNSQAETGFDVEAGQEAAVETGADNASSIKIEGVPEAQIKSFEDLVGRGGENAIKKTSRLLEMVQSDKASDPGKGLSDSEFKEFQGNFIKYLNYKMSETNNREFTSGQKFKIAEHLEVLRNKGAHSLTEVATAKLVLTDLFKKLEKK